MNNIIAVSRPTSVANSMFAIGAALSSDFATSNWNDLYIPQGQAATLSGSAVATFANLLASGNWVGRDVNSISGDPKWKSDQDLHWVSYESAIIKKGSYMAA